MENELSKLHNTTQLSAFQNGESGEGTPPLAILDWGNWDMTKVGVGVGVTSYILWYGALKI